MGIVVRFAVRRHARASSRAAKRVSKSGVTPAALARSVDNTLDHHSGGIRSRCDHLRAAACEDPTSSASTSNEGQSPMIDRKEVKSDMAESMGQSVPKIKAIMSHDTAISLGHSVPMAQDDEDIAESEWREAFRQRLITLRGARTQETMARLLGISRDRYAKYEIKGKPRMMSPRLLPKLADICGIGLRELIEGDGLEQPITKPEVRKKRA